MSVCVCVCVFLFVAMLVWISDLDLEVVTGHALLGFTDFKAFKTWTSDFPQNQIKQSQIAADSLGKR